MASKDAVVLDFSDVKDAPEVKPKRVPEGDYRARIVSVETKTIKNSENKQWMFVIEIPGASGKPTYAYYCQLTPKMLWKIRHLFLAAGVMVPKSKVTVDPQRIIGRSIAVTMVDDEYEGKEKSKIDTVFALKDLADTATEEEGDEDEEEEDEDEEGAAEEVKPVAAKKSAAKKTAAKPPAVTEDELDELDIDDI